MPAFLIPMLIGAGVGAITNPDDRLRGALLGGTLGALTGGLGTTATGGAGATQGALSAATAPTLQSGLGAAASGASNAGANAAAKAASQAAINSAKVGAPIDIAQIAANTPVTGATRDIAQIAAETPALKVEAQKLSGFDKAKAIVKDKPYESAMFAQNVLGGGQQQQAAPMQMAPIQQGSFGMPMTAEERLAMSGGDDPMFVQRGLFSEVKSDFQTEEEEDLMMQQMRLAGLV